MSSVSQSHYYQNIYLLFGHADFPFQKFIIKISTHYVDGHACETQLICYTMESRKEGVGVEFELIR